MKTDRPSLAAAACAGISDRDLAFVASVQNPRQRLLRLALAADMAIPMSAPATPVHPANSEAKPARMGDRT